MTEKAIQYVKRHRRVTKDAFFFFGCTVTLVLVLALSISPSDEGDEFQNQRNLSKHSHTPLDYSAYSCDNLSHYTTHHKRQKQCAYARTCNDGEGIWIPSVYCSEKYSITALGLMWSPFVVLVGLVLFRMVSSTAEDFFSPALEMLSLEMGLPPRFAGVTLLALGNGAPDIAATVNAIRNDKKIGYLMSLGELTGSGMFIGTVITGVIVVVANNVNCGHALIRDVTMLFVTNLLIFTQFTYQGTIDGYSIRLWISIYFVYVLVVALSDWYHNKFVSPKLERNQIETERKEQEHEGIDPKLSKEETADELTKLLPDKQHGRLSNTMDHMLEVMSNYDDEIDSNLGESGWAKKESDGIEPLMVVHPHHGGVINMSARNKLIQETPLRVPSQISDISDESVSAGVYEFYKRNTTELSAYWIDFWKDIYHNEENNLLDKFLLTLELPFTICRKASVPITCNGYYCRPMVGLSTALSTFWLQYYFEHEYDMNLFNMFPFNCLVIGVPFLIGLSIIFFCPEGEGPMPLLVAVPIGLYGFMIAATWIDLIADILVDVLTFTGVLCGIPATLMGATVLAVGNSIGDLSANLTIARKGLSDMAITACFAGPVFNMLIGLGLGFTALRKMTKLDEINVYLTPELKAGFLFSIANCALLIIFGVFIGAGTLRYEYGYFALTLYIVYTITALLV